MKFYSEILRKVFDSATECQKAEAKYNEKLAADKAKQEALSKTRKDRAKEVEDAYHASIAAQKNYLELRDKFVRDYGSWHMTISSPEGCDLFDTLFNIL